MIHDDDGNEISEFVLPDGSNRLAGLIPRDYSSFPVGCYGAAPPYPDSALIPEAEWPERFAEYKAKKQSLLYTRERLGMQSLDQDGYPLCWAFSVTKMLMYQMALMGLGLRVLSAWYVAGMAAGWRSRGGWCQQSLDAVIGHGAPEYSLCPSYSSRNVTDETRTNAALHKAVEFWDGSNDRDKARHQMISRLLLGEPLVLDLNWMAHSMCGMHLESLNPLEVWADNSWGQSAGNKGMYVLKGNKAIPDGSCYIRQAMAR